jgi:hypothetical protein
MPAAPTLDKTTQFALDFFAAQCGHFTNRCEDALYPHFTLASTEPMYGNRVWLSFCVEMTPFAPKLPPHFTNPSTFDKLKEPCFSAQCGFECIVPEVFNYQHILHALAREKSSSPFIKVISNSALLDASQEEVRAAVEWFETLEDVTSLTHSTSPHARPHRTL